MSEGDSINQHLHMLCVANSTEQELEALRLLNINLANVHTTHCDADFIERQYLTQSKTVLEEGNPYPLFEVAEFVFPKSNCLRDFVNYVFIRRYGWSEVLTSGEKLTVQRIHGIGCSSKDEAAMKSQLNELLDEYLKWLLCQQLNHELISSLQYTVQQAINHPVIRKQTFIHILEWFRSTCTVFHEEFFESSKGLIILGLTDVWSAIRSACASKLNSIAEQFNITQLEMFFLALVQICRDSESSWQAKEGAVMGLNVIVRRFQWVGSNEVVGTSYSAKAQPEAKKTEYYLRFGKEALQNIPEFISTQLHDVIFLLLSDPQLSIREHAIKTFSSYLSRCDSQEAMSSFNEVISALCKGCGLSQENMALFVDVSYLVTFTGFKWMDAYLAEGLLGMCIFLVKHIPPEYLLPSWTLCMNTLSLYLMHPASTVRQATSKIVKFLVAKDTSNPAILKLVLSSLSSNWTVDVKLLTQECLPENYTNLPESTQVYINGNQSPNPSIKSLNFSTNSLGEQSDTLVSSTWEWREGRLLAYELVFQFLIKNHWLYTFGAAATIKSHHNSYSEDHRRSQSPANMDSLRPLQTYGGASMQTFKSNSSTTVNGAYNRSLNLREMNSALASPSPSHSPLSDSPNSSFDMPFPRHSYSGSAEGTRDTLLKPRFYSPGGNISPQLRPRRHIGVERPSMKSMPRPGMQLKRRATVDHLNPLAIKTATILRRYPYTDKSTTSMRTGDGVNIHALPLISAVKYFESTTSGSSSRLAQNVSSSADQNLSTKSVDAMETVKRRLKNRSEEKSMSELLINILHQATECVNSASWELRRMAQQVLPCLVEIMRWYDMSLLTKYWSDNLSTETSVMSYGASLSFLYSVSHAAKLSPLLHDPPDNWQDLEACKDEVKKIIECMSSQVSLYVPIFMQILKRPTLDKLTVIAVQVLLTSSSFIGSAKISIDPSLDEGLLNAVDCIKTVTVLCYPTGRIQKYKPPLPSNRILLPGSGFLSCNPLDSDQLSVTTHHLLKYLLEHIHSLLVSFVRHLDVKCTYTLLPCLVKFLRGQYSTVHINRAFTDSVLAIFEKLAPLVIDPSEENFDLSMRKRVYETKNDAFYELIVCVTDKDADKHILHMALDCLFGLLQHADSCRYLLPLCKSVCSQLSSGQGSSSQNRPCADDLAILSNDIRESMEAELVEDSDSDDDESVLLELDHQESLALHNSGGTTGSGRQSALSQRSAGDASGGVSLTSDGDSDSDWDSWDEQEEESTDKESVFQEFLQKVYHSFQSQGRLDEFHTSLKKLPQSEFRLIKSLVKI